MIKLWQKIKHWYWWNFKATEAEKSRYDMVIYGTGIMKNGKRIDPKVMVADKWEEMRIPEIDLMYEPLYFSKECKIIRQVIRRDGYLGMNNKMPSEYKIKKNTDFSYTVYYKY
jgi:hypothetical protein